MNAEDAENAASSAQTQAETAQGLAGNAQTAAESAAGEAASDATLSQQAEIASLLAKFNSNTAKMAAVEA